MRAVGPFDQRDLDALDTLFQMADRVVPMRDIHKGDSNPRTIGLRHDVDDNPGSLETAVRMAEWEFEHGYSSTYYLLHDSHYWNDEMLVLAEHMQELGHEIGLHVNAISIALRDNRIPGAVLLEALEYLRTSVRVVGCVAHGDMDWCYHKGDLLYVNDEMFSESARPDLGAPDRTITAKNGVRLRLVPLSREVFGLEYDANWLPRGDYMSDSGYTWRPMFEEVKARFGEGQLHVLVHPDWWARAFQGVTV